MADDKIKKGDNIDQIRQLIFGEQSREYDRQINNIRKQIQSLRKDLKDSVLELKSDMEKLDARNDQSHKEMLDLLDQTSKKFQQSLKKTNANLSDKIEKLRMDKTDRLQLANYLIELAVRLKGEDIMEQLIVEAESPEDGS